MARLHLLNYNKETATRYDSLEDILSSAEKCSKQDLHLLQCAQQYTQSPDQVRAVALPENSTVGHQLEQAMHGQNKFKKMTSLSQN